MSRARAVHRCTTCAASTPRWQGRCPACGSWNSLQAVPAAATPLPTGRRAGAEACPIDEVELGGGVPVPTGVAEVDRVLGGGLVPGSVTLLGGEPGIGKSTLLLQVAAAMAAAGRRVLYTSGEESAAQVGHRAARLDARPADLWLLPETALPAVLAEVDRLTPDVLIVDSVQSLADPDTGGVPGSVAQLREVAGRLTEEAKRRSLTVLLVGHVTKEGALAGPRVLEHVVDTVLAFEGDRHHALRLLRAVKHRFGSTAELGVFEMTGPGLVGVADPSALFLADRRPGVPGSAVVPVLDGNRPLLVEVEALTAPSFLAAPRRSALGLDSGRVNLLLAVLQRRVGLDVSRHDVYTLAVGGVRVAEPGADLAVALAVASARLDAALPVGWVTCAEVGLAGEVRRVGHLERRLSEAARLGFETALVPHDSPPVPGLRLLEVASLTEALAAAGLGG